MQAEKTAQAPEPKVAREGAKAVVSPTGDIVAATEKVLRGRLRELVQDGVREITLDLAGVDMVDSLGVGLLISTHNSLSRAGGRLTAVNVHKSIYDLFTIMRINQLFTVTCA